MVSPGNRGASFALIGEGPYARVYRGRGPGGEFALKVQKETAPVPNIEAEKRFNREYAALVEHGGGDPGLPGLEPVPGFTGEAGPPRFEPLFLCRERGIYFHLPCPKCMRVHTLVDCRDDDVLTRSGLPSFATSLARYLWCSACGKEETVFYARRSPAGTTLVRDFESLVTSLRSTVDRGVDETPIPSELMDGLNEEFPCMTCENRAACFPREAGKRGLAEVRLSPVSMNEFFAFPLPLCSLEFDEAADLLSGASPSDMMKLHGKAWAAPALRQMKSEAIETVSVTDPIGALRAKVDLVVRGIQAVLRLHEATGWPHLAVAPRHLLVEPRENEDPLVQLIAPQGALPLKSIRQPPAEAATPYSDPVLHQEAFGRPTAVRVHIQKVWSGKGDTFFAAELRGEALPRDVLGEDDLIRLTFDDTGWEGIRIWGNRLPGGLGVTHADSISIVTTPATLDITQVNDLKSAKGQSPLFAKAIFYRDYSVPFDVYSLGMLLFRSLLVNEVQDWETIRDEVVAPVSASLRLLSANRPDAGMSDFRKVIEDELSREPIDSLSDRRNVWHRPDEVTVAGISESAWFDLLCTGFRAITHLEGFSFCPTDRFAAATDQTVPARAMLDAIQEITGRLVTEAPDDEDLMSVEPLTQDDLREITGEVAAELQAQVEQLEQELATARGSLVALEEAWTRIYKGVSGLEDKVGPPRDTNDARIPIMAATVGESVECVLKVFKAVARFGGDELGEGVPKIRLLIQRALQAEDGVHFDPEPELRRIRRQLKAVQLFLFGTLKTFLEAHAYAAKHGTEKVLGKMRDRLFEADPKKKGRLPSSEEIQRRFEAIAEELPGQHGRLFQPYFQEFVKKQLSKLS